MSSRERSGDLPIIRKTTTFNIIWGLSGRSSEVFIHLSFVIISTTKSTIFVVNFHRPNQVLQVCVSVCTFSSLKCYCEFCYIGLRWFWVEGPHNMKFYMGSVVPHIINLTLYGVLWGPTELLGLCMVCCGTLQNYWDSVWCLVVPYRITKILYGVLWYLLTYLLHGAESFLRS